MRNCYTYLIGWSELDTWYYGCRWGENCDPSDLWITYFTSSIYVDNFRKEYKEPDIIQVRKIFGDDVCGVQLYEHKVLRRMKVFNDIRFINRSEGTPKHINPGLWYNNGKIDIRSIEHPGEGWERGSLTHKNIGRIWWNNGTKQKLSNKSPGKNWVEGMLSKSNYSYEWYTNGNDSKQVLEGETPPFGWYKGYTPKGNYSKWYYVYDEESSTKLFGDIEIPLGMYRGRLRLKSLRKLKLPDPLEHPPWRLEVI